MTATTIIKLPEEFPVKCVDCLRIFSKTEIKSFQLLSREYELYGDSLFAYTCRNCLHSNRRELYRFKITMAEFLYLLLYHLSFQSFTFTSSNGYRLFSVYTLLSFVEKYWDYYMFENKSNWRKRVIDCLLKDEYKCFVLVTSYNESDYEDSEDDDDVNYCDPWLCGLKDLHSTPKLLNSNIRELLQMHPDGLLLGKKRLLGSSSSSSSNGMLVDDVNATAVAVVVATTSSSTTTTTTAATSSANSSNRMKRTKSSSTSTRSNSTSKKKKSRSLKDKRPCTMLFLDIPNPLLGKKEDVESPLMTEPVRILNHLTHSAPQICVEAPENLVCWNPTRGYRMAKASHGVREGCWYYECEVLELPHGGESNCRIGFSQISGDLQAPCGYDQFSYGFRPQPPTVFHQSVGKDYGLSVLLQMDYKLCVGDVFGCMIYLPSISSRSVDENDPAENLVVPANHDKLPSPWNPSKPYDPVPYYGTRPQLKKSFVKFFVNGQDLGVASEDLYLGKYHPAVSMFNGTKLKCNFGHLETEKEGNFGLKHLQEAKESCPEVRSFCELQLYKEF